jgi:hypothetical protein
MTDTYKLEPSDIRQCWDEVRPGLEAIKTNMAKACTWRVEDVYAACVNNDAVLYRTEDGFAVCTLEPDRFTGDTDLLIWIAYSYKPESSGTLTKYWPSFIEVAARLGCRGIQTQSLHPALDSWGVMDKLYTTYRYELNG